jgi:ketosteroid isomerase-like protein
MKTKNVQSIICLVIFFLFANQAWAADWIYYDTADFGDSYYDKNSIKKIKESIISVWTKNILSEEAKTKYFSILKEIHKAPDDPSMLCYYAKLMEIDCVNEKIKDTSVTIYDEKGDVIYSSPKGESGKWNDIIPISVGERLKNIVCKEPATSEEAVVTSRVEEPVAPKEAVVAPKVEEPVTPKEAVVVASPHYYEGIKGIVLKNGKVIEGQIISIDDNDVLKIRTKEGKILSYFFIKEVKEYIPISVGEKLKNIVCKEPATPKEAVVVAPIAGDNLAQVNNKQNETKYIHEEAVRNLVNKWLTSWKSGDIKTYRSCYASNFHSEEMDLNAWISHKAAVRQNSKNINIRIDNLQISVGVNTAVAVFTQSYSSSMLKDKGKKTLELKKINDEWKIYREIMYP